MDNIQINKFALDGIKVKKLDVKKDERGFFAEILRIEELRNKKKKFGQIYLTVAKPNQTKGKHTHKRKTEYFSVIKGNGLLTLVDKKGNKRKEIKMGEDNMVMVTIPPNIWHAIKNTGEDDLYLLAYIDESYNPEDPDTFHEEI